MANIIWEFDEKVSEEWVEVEGNGWVNGSLRSWV